MLLFDIQCPGVIAGMMIGIMNSWRDCQRKRICGGKRFKRRSLRQVLKCGLRLDISGRKDGDEAILDGLGAIDSNGCQISNSR